MTVFLRNHGPVSPSAGSPIILGTDIGGDPDDPLTLTAALDLAFVRVVQSPITVDDDGRTSIDRGAGP